MANKEIGRIGQRRYGGIVYEEFLHELRGKRGIEVYREMSENDDVVGAILFAIEMLVRQCDWNVEPGGDTAKDKEAAEFVKSCMDDMQETWTDTISEILSFLTYGWSFHEIVYKRRMGNTKNPKTKSKYNDGLIGWQKLPIRAQETLYEWEYDDEDNLLGMTQMPPPDFGLFTIPLGKAMLFRTKSRKNNPEGRSILRNAYRCFDEKTEILTLNGWKNGMDITTEEKLVTLNPFTGQIEYQNPTEINHYFHSGEMIHFSNRFIDIRVTPNHRMWARKDRQKMYKIVTASEICKSDKFIAHGKWKGVEREKYIIPEYEVYQKFRDGERKLKEVKPQINIDMDEWLSFMGLYLSEGCTYVTKRGQALVSIVQKEGDGTDKMRFLFKKLPFCVYEHKGKNRKISFEIFDRRLYEELKVFGKAWEKYVPDYIKKLSPRQINIFLDWYWFGDGTKVGGAAYKGTVYKGTRQIFTTSERMADDLQELALLCGCVGRKRTKPKQESHCGNRPLYIVTIGKAMEFSAGTQFHEEYDGMVWCPTTENGIVYVRRNGKAAWVGNCWYFKRRIQEIEGIGIERDLAGLPVMHGPEGLDLWDDTIEQNVKARAGMERMVRNIRRDEMEGVVLPAGYTLELLSSGGTRQFDTNAIINRYDTRIAMTVLADFIFLGHSETGSWALSSDKTELFAVAIGAFLDIICETFNSQGIPSLIDINGEHFAGITEYPKMTHGDIEDMDITKVATFLKDMTGIGLLVPDDGLEDYIRQVGHLPERTSDTRNIDGRRKDLQERNEPPEPETVAGTGPEGDREEIPEEDKKADAAKKRLGRSAGNGVSDHAAKAAAKGKKREQPGSPTTA